MHSAAERWCRGAAAGKNARLRVRGAATEQEQRRVPADPKGAQSTYAAFREASISPVRRHV
jgi:hypothetical protein